MANNWSLKKTAQCAKCPWRKDVNPFDIPDGYSLEAHKALSATIAAENEGYNYGNQLRAMACHETNVSQETYCVGWLHNQLTVGNNIPLRLKMRTCDNIEKLKLIGEQHACFNETIPNDIP